MERRKSPRLVLNLDARIGHHGLRELACVIRDFSHGGVFVELSDEKAASKLKLDERLKIILPALSASDDSHLLLNGRIVRKVGSVMLGIAFLSPPKSTLDKLENYLKARPKAEKMKLASKPPQTTHHALLELCKSICTQSLNTMMTNLIQHCGEVLFDNAQRAKNNLIQTRCFEAISNIQSNADLLKQGFTATIVSHWDNPFEYYIALDKGEAESQSELSLVDDDKFEYWLTITSIITELENRFDQPLYELYQRLLVIFEDLPEQLVPAGPTMMGHVFEREMAKRLSVNLSNGKIICRQFQRVLEDDLGEMYAQLNICLDEGGVQPELSERRAVWKNSAVQDEHLSSENKVTDNAALASSINFDIESFASLDKLDVNPVTDALISQSSPLEIGPPANHPQPSTDVYSTLANLLSINRQHSGSQNSHATSNEQKQALLKALSATSDRSRVDFANLDNEQAVGEIVQQLTSRDGVLNGQIDENLILVGKLLDAILAQYPDENAAGKWFQKLRLPLIKAILLDPNCFHQETHPVRRVVNQLSELATLVGGDVEKNKLNQTVDFLLDNIASNHQEDNSVFSEVISVLDSLVFGQQQIKSINENKISTHLTQQEAFNNAKQIASYEVFKKLGGKRFPKVISDLCKNGWIDLMAMGYLEGRRDHKAWKLGTSVIEELVDCCGRPKLEKLDLRASNLINIVTRGLESVNSDVKIAEVIIKDLSRALLGCDSTEVLLDSNDVSLDDSGKESMLVDSSPWVERCRNLEIGNAFQFRLEDDVRQLRLAWVNTDMTQFVFSDALGMKAIELSVSQFADYLQQGSIQLIQDEDLSFVERGMFRLVQQTYDQLSHQASHDSLTDIFNRKHMERSIDRAIQKTQSHQASHVFCYLNLDNFAYVNSKAGVKAGDALLTQLASLLVERVDSQSDVVARVGGDEFAVLLHNTTRNQGYKFARSLITAIESFEFQWEGKKYPNSWSIGMTEITQRSRTIDEVIDAAHSACRGAKDSGGQRVHHFRPNDVSVKSQSGRIRWLTKINHDLEEDNLVLRCQRIVPIDKIKIKNARYEVLLGVYDDTGALVSPAEFIQSAESLNRIQAVDRWVVGNVFRSLKEHRQQLHQICSLSVNLSGASLTDLAFKYYILRQLEECRFSPSKICFEITETAAIENLDIAIEFVEDLRRIGFRFSLDDFGTGLASYNYLRKIPVDYVKIDGSFVTDIANNGDDYALVKSINEIAHFMEKETIAEYVENDAILEQLKEIGVDYAQGYGIEKPKLMEKIWTQEPSTAADPDIASKTA